MISLVLVVVLLGIRHLPVYLVVAGGSLLMVIGGLVQAARTGWSLRWLGMVAFFAVVLQGVLGGLRVVWAMDELGIFHAALAQAFLNSGCEAYVAPTDYVHANAALFFAIHLFYFLAAKRSLSEAVEESRKHDTGCSLFKLWCSGSQMRGGEDSEP